VGDYLVVGVLGTGGMATVYEAVQDNPKRRVALKVMHHSLSRTDALDRFRLEAETLARLHHPGIAQIYEAGMARLGAGASSPFFAMELIPRALSITKYADRHACSLRQRLTMFASVCDAVHHGHQHGVIHRDLKPDNVLVDGEGRAKIIDFGVARTLESTRQPLTAESDIPRLIGTLNYMSPEQCTANADIDIRTDVYSLGVLLYELTCGNLPHDLSGLPIPAAVERIVQAPPRTPQWPASRLHRDLEAIMFMAMHKVPEHRYQSAAALAADLRRLLQFQAIEARPPGLIDHFRLFARRHRALVAVMVVLAISTILIALISTGFAMRLADEVDRRTQAEQKTARERDAAQWEAYTAQIAGALSAMRTGEFVQMRTRLAAAAYRHKGWEWGFLSRLAERSAGNIVGHDAYILDVAASSDRTRFITTARDGSVKLWNLQDDAPIASFESESGAQCRAAAWTTDARHVIVGDDEGFVRLLNASNLSSLETIARLTSAVRSVVPLPEGRVAAAADDGSATVWTLDPRSAVPFPSDQPGGIHGLTASHDGSLLATFNDQGHVWLRSAADLSVRQRLVYPGSIKQVRFSADDRLVAAAGAGGAALVWNTSDATLARTLQATNEVNSLRSLAFSSDASIIAIGLTHRGLVIMSLADGRVVGELGGHTDAVSGLFFTPGDQLLVSASWDRSIRTWRTTEFEAPSGVLTLTGHQDHVRGLAFSPDGSMVASVSADGDLRLWDPDLARPFATIPLSTSNLNAVTFSRDASRIAVAGGDGMVRIIHADSGRVALEFKGDGRSVASVAFDSAGEQLAAGFEDGTIRVWNLRTPELRLVLKAHKARVNSLQFSPDGATLASGSRDHTVATFNTSSGENIHRFTDHSSDVFAVLFSHDGRHLFSGSRDQSVRVWNVQTGQAITTLTGHGQYVTCLALNPDGTRLAAGSWFGEIVLFDVATFDQIASFRAHDAAIRSISFSPDGRWLASASYDATVRLFDSATREAADAAHQRALASWHAAESRLTPLFDPPPANIEALLKRLAESGLDPASDPWVRKAVLSKLRPAQSPP
jgi:eukaryotic-like serine/threonine-protein kinase